VLTTFANDDHVYDALAAGADGFLLKRSSPEEVIHGIRTVARGESLLFPDAVRELARRHVRATGSGTVPGLERLTPREREVLLLVAQGLSNAEVAERLVVGVETVRTHVASVLAKTGARDRTQAVVLAYQSGFVPPG
jgi:DNA-binding NarL/FixJ family response regulator